MDIPDKIIPIAMSPDNLHNCIGIAFDAQFGDVTQTYCLPYQSMNGKINTLSGESYGLEFRIQYPGKEDFPVTTVTQYQVYVQGENGTNLDPNLAQIQFNTYDADSKLIEQQSAVITPDDVLFYTEPNGSSSFFATMLPNRDSEGNIVFTTVYGVIDWGNTDLDAPILLNPGITVARVIYMSDPISQAMSENASPIQ